MHYTEKNNVYTVCFSVKGKSFKQTRIAKSPEKAIQQVKEEQDLESFILESIEERDD